MKNAFYFTLKALLVFKMFKYLYWLFGNVKNGLVRKIRINSKFMTLQPGSQKITIHILSNISRSKDNQAMKFG